jgi:hypothetical protein
LLGSKRRQLLPLEPERLVEPPPLLPLPEVPRERADDRCALDFLAPLPLPLAEPRPRPDFADELDFEDEPDL